MPVSTLPEDIEMPEPEPQPRWMIPAGVAAGILGVIALAFYFGPLRAARCGSSFRDATCNGSRGFPKNRHLRGATKKESQGDSGCHAGAEGIETGYTRPAQAGAKQPAVAKQAAGVILDANAPPELLLLQVASTTAPAGERRVTVKASAMNWISACSDGKPVFADLLKTGGSKDIDFHSTAVIRVGNAAAAEIYVDGKSVGALGNPGTVKILEISANGVRPLPPDLSPDAECHSKP